MTTKPLSQVLSEYPQLVGPTGPGVIAGGTAGQILAKNSGTDFDTKWEDAPTGGGAAWTLAQTWTWSANIANIDFKNLGAYTDILVLADKLLMAAASTVWLLGSTDNGVTFYNNSGNYMQPRAGSQPAATNSFHGLDAGATSVSTAWRLINVPDAPTICCSISGDTESYLLASLAAVNALRVQQVTGANFTGGKIYILAR